MKKVIAFLTFAIFTAELVNICFLYQNLEDKDTGDHSVSTFGYSLRRHNSVVSGLSSYDRFHEVKVPGLETLKAIRSQVMYVSKNDWNKATGENSGGKFILVTRSALYSLDVKGLKLKKLASFGNADIRNVTPTLDLDRGLIYIRFKQRLKSFHFSGRLESEIEYDFDKLFKKKYSQYAADDYFCNSSLTLVRNKHQKVLSFGCTGKNFDRKKGVGAYGDIQGASGFLASFQINEKGHFLTSDPFIFFTSQKRKHTMTGFNGGIWLSGGGVSYVDNKVIFPVGNGGFFPTLGNYGCSLVRLDTSQLDRLDNGLNDLAYTSPFVEGFQECMVSNYEWAAGQSPVIRYGDKEYRTFVAGKAGRVYIINPFDMRGGDRSHFKSVEVNTRFKPHRRMNNYGSLAVFSTGREEIHAMHVGLTDQSESFVFRGSESAVKVLLRREGIDLKRSGFFVRRSCEGHILEKGAEERRARYLYSGSFYKKNFMTNSDSVLFQKLSQYGVKPFLFKKQYKSIDQWHPAFREFFSEGFFADKSYKGEGTLNDINDISWGGNIYLKSGYRSEKNFRDTIKRASAFYHNKGRNFFIKFDQDRCEKRKGLIPIYRWYFTHEGSRRNYDGWKVEMISLERGRTAKKKIYEYQYDGKQRLTVSSSLLALTTEKKASLAFIPTRSDEVVGKGTIDVIDIQRGRKLQSLPLSGIMKFSLPTLAGKYLAIPTINDAGSEGRVHIFKAKKDWFSFWLHHSLIMRWLL